MYGRYDWEVNGRGNEVTGDELVQKPKSQDNRKIFHRNTSVCIKNGDGGDRESHELNSSRNAGQSDGSL